MDRLILNGLSFFITCMVVTGHFAQAAETRPKEAPKVIVPEKSSPESIQALKDFKRDFKKCLDSKERYKCIENFIQFPLRVGWVENEWACHDDGMHSYSKEELIKCMKKSEKNLVRGIYSCLDTEHDDSEARTGVIEDGYPYICYVTRKDSKKFRIYAMLEGGG